MTHTQIQEKQKPANEIRIGNAKAVIWANEIDGVLRYNVNLSRIYKDGGTWKETHSFARDDLPRVTKCADLAYEWIFTKGQANQPTAEQQ